MSITDLILWSCSAGKEGRQRRVPSGPKLELSFVWTPLESFSKAAELAGFFQRSLFHFLASHRLGNGLSHFSCGYGLVRANEEIHSYSSIFGNYLARLRPSRVFMALSKRAYLFSSHFSGVFLIVPEIGEVRHGCFNNL